MSLMAFASLEPILALRLDEYDLGQTYQGLIFGIQPLTYTLATFLTPYIVPSWFERRGALIINLFLLGTSQLFIGPFYTDKNLIVMCVALLISGFFLGPLMILPMQEMMISTKLKYPDYDFEHATNLLSGLMNSAVGVGQAIGPIFGASLY
mmetsp:Transcript_31703/g.41994  ORF Transcript_31703/g.41994 Transcript_31703/m.41994 type:complete len:151 (+) Transcript_31703:509-961(+)